MSHDRKEQRTTQQFEHYIGGRSQPPETGQYFPSDNPCTGQDWAHIAQGTAPDINRAVDAATLAFPGWAGLKPYLRGRHLSRLADLIDIHADELARIEVQDNGKLYAEMSAQTHYIAQWYRYYGGLADKIEGSVIPTDKADIFNFTRYEPLGVIGMITPWNSPLLLLSWKLAAALAAGNTVVIKPSEFTSASTLTFAKLFESAGFPPGVVNVVTGFGNEAGAALVEHPGIAKIAFTGSDISGQLIYQAAARTIKHVSLELGGKSPNIVFADANLEAAIMGVISGIFAAAGQTCIAGSRLLVERSIHDQLVERLVAVAGAAHIGDPMDHTTHIGPIATAPQFKKVMEYIAIAKSEGARCVLGGESIRVAGLAGERFVQPTIFTNVNNSMRIAREEVFGPILAIIPFDTEEDAYAIANDTCYGLGAGVWTSDIARALRAAERIQAGTIWINTYRALSYMSPFGGYKRSGVGREGGIDAIKEYLQLKSVWISTNPDVANPFIMR